MGAPDRQALDLLLLAAADISDLSHIVGERLQHLADGALEDGMPHLGRDLSQRLENESPFVNGNVGHIQLRRVDDGISEEKNVDINSARTLRLDATAAHLLLDR